MSTRPPFRRLLIVLGALCLATTGTLGTAAQESTPVATPSTDAERGAAYPVSIHEGTCEDVVAQPVGPAIETNVAGLDDDAELIGPSSEEPVLVATADYDGTIDYFTESPHVIAIHESPETYGTIVACGEIAGYSDGDELVFAIRSGPDSSVSGIATVRENTTVVDQALDLVDQSVDFGDDSVHVTVYVIPGETGIDASS